MRINSQLGVLAALVAFLNLVGCSAQHAKDAAEKQIAIAERVADVRDGITANLAEWPEDRVEQSAIVLAVIDMLPEAYRAGADRVLADATDLRQALDDINAGYLANVQAEAEAQADKLADEYESAADKDERSLGMFLGIAGGFLSILTGGGWLGARRTLANVVTGVENAQISDEAWEPLSASLRNTTGQSDRRKINAIKARLKS